MGRMSRAWRWLWSPVKPDEEQWSKGAYHCPRCGQELPAFRPGNRFARLPMWSTPTESELVWKCPYDGHPPFNDKAREMLEKGTLPVTRSPDAP